MLAPVKTTKSWNAPPTVIWPILPPGRELPAESVSLTQRFPSGPDAIALAATPAPNGNSVMRLLHTPASQNDVDVHAGEQIAPPAPPVPAELPPVPLPPVPIGLPP